MFHTVELVWPHCDANACCRHGHRHPISSRRRCYVLSDRKMSLVGSANRDSISSANQKAWFAKKFYRRRGLGIRWIMKGQRALLFWVTEQMATHGPLSSVKSSRSCNPCLTSSPPVVFPSASLSLELAFDDGSGAGEAGLDGTDGYTAR